MAALMTIGITGKRIEEFNESKAICALLWPGEMANMSNARVLSVAMQALKTCYESGIEIDYKWHDGRVSTGTTADLIARLWNACGAD